jgi:hypothetical protein
MIHSCVNNYTKQKACTHLRPGIKIEKYRWLTTILTTSAGDKISAVARAMAVLASHPALYKEKPRPLGSRAFFW